MLTLTATLREYAMYLGKGTPQSTLLTIAHGASATEATTPDAIGGSVALQARSQQEGLLITDMEFDGVESTKVCWADFMLDLDNRYTTYLPVNGNFISLGFFVRHPKFTITNGNATNSLLVSIQSISLTYYDYKQLLKSLSYQMAPPFGQNSEPIV